MESPKDSKTTEELGWNLVTKEEVFPILRRYDQKAVFFHHYIENTLKWSSRFPSTETTLYLSVNSRWEGSIIIDVKGPMNFVVVFWPYIDISYLISSLRENAIVDIKGEPRFMFDVPEESYKSLEQSMKSLGVDIIRNVVVRNYFMPAHEAENIEVDVPKHINVIKLDRRHAFIVNSKWYGARQDSIKFIKDMISMNHSLGLIPENESNLACWLLQTNYSLGMLHTLPEHRRKGYGSMLVKLMSKKIGEEGKDVIALVDETNSASKLMFKKIGFQESYTLKIITTQMASK